jgi:hypothetical protein
LEKIFIANGAGRLKLRRGDVKEAAFVDTTDAGD